VDRAKRLLGFWQYLPAFRFVAETESVSAAARNLGVTPSAVSRSLSHLESAVGQPLFAREGRSLRLNRAGERLLLSVRRAMRGIDDGLEVMDGGRLVGPVRLAAVEPIFGELLPPLLRALVAAQPSLVPSVGRLVEERLRQDLATGTLDVAFSTWVPNKRAEDLTVRRLGSVRLALYAPPKLVGTATRLRAGETPGHVELASHLRRGGPWPVDRPREVRAVVDDLATAARVAKELDLVTVLPTSMGERSDLVELSTPRLAPQPLFVVTRSRLEEDSRSEIVAALAVDLAGSVFAR
jgi:DNA-binding transcriptional LysR family regulator